MKYANKERDLREASTTSMGKGKGNGSPDATLPAKFLEQYLSPAKPSVMRLHNRPKHRSGAVIHPVLPGQIPGIDDVSVQ